MLDVRSPAEYAQGHIPHAISLPLFSDQQRAEIGIAYNTVGRQPAVLKGLEFIGPRLSSIVEAAVQYATPDGLLLHCWRGGMRSQSLAQMLDLAELDPTVLDGGYKAFRRFARGWFERPYRLIVVSGLTGAGKTKVLQMLASAGEQVIDLEQLANHRGSAFGGIGQGSQPTPEQFENNLFEVLFAFDMTRPVWIEDEGNRVGSVVVPEALYQAIRNAPAVCIEVRPDQRLENLLADYGDLAADQLVHAIGKISKRLDGRAAQTAVAAVESGNLPTAIQITLDYYDRTYLKAMEKMPRDKTVALNISTLNADEIVAALREVANF